MTDPRYQEGMPPPPQSGQPWMDPDFEDPTPFDHDGWPHDPDAPPPAGRAGDLGVLDELYPLDTPPEPVPTHDPVPVPRVADPRKATLGGIREQLRRAAGGGSHPVGDDDGDDNRAAFSEGEVSTIHPTTLLAGAAMGGLSWWSTSGIAHTSGWDGVLRAVACLLSAVLVGAATMSRRNPWARAALAALGCTAVGIAASVSAMAPVVGFVALGCLLLGRWRHAA